MREALAGLVIANGEVIRYSTRLKYYGDDLTEIMMCSKAVFNPNGKSKCSSQRGRKKKNVCSNERLKAEVEVVEVGENDKEASNDSLERSKRRARKNVFDYAMCNPDLNLFITFTLDQKKIDRFNYKNIIKKLNNWLDNRVRRKGLKYVLVAEHHKNGAIHFHGLINESAVALKDSGHVDKNGRQIFNVVDWELGFSTAVRVYGQRGSVCKYIVKYISKSTEKVGGRWYYSGGALESPSYEYMGSTTIEDWQGLEGYESYTKRVEEIGIQYNILTKKY